MRWNLEVLNFQSSPDIFSAYLHGYKYPYSPQDQTKTVTFVLKF